MKKFVVVWVIFLLLFTFFSYLFVDTNLFYLRFLITGFFDNYRVLTTIVYILFLSLFFIFYVYFLRTVQKNHLDIKKIKTLLAITVGLLFFSYPAMLSFDIFNYMATAKVLFFYHENPYIIMPIEITREPLLAFMHAPNKVALYGPVWILLTGIPYVLSLGKFVLFLFSMKALVVGFFLGTVLLLWKMSKNMFTVVFFAFNPLVIIETLVSGHNDIVMMFFAILGMYFLLMNKRGRGIVFLLSSILIKYATVFLVPVYWYLGKQKNISPRILQNIFTYAAVSLFVIFLLSPIREELYSWYFIWVLPFVALSKNNTMQVLSIAFSFGLMLRYIPFMLLGTYFGPTPALKIIVTTIPVILCLAFLLFKRVVNTRKTR